MAGLAGGRDMSMGQLLGFQLRRSPRPWYLYLPWTLLASVATRRNTALPWPISLVYGAATILLFRQSGLLLAEKIVFALSYFLFWIWHCQPGLHPRSAYRSMAGPCLKTNKRRPSTSLIQTARLRSMVPWSLPSSFLPVRERGWTPTKYLLAALGWALPHFVIPVFPRGNEDDFTRAYVQGGFSIDKLKLVFQGMLGNTFGISASSPTLPSVASLHLGMAVSCWL